jgi:hypothetical protein
MLASQAAWLQMHCPTSGDALPKQKRVETYCHDLLFLLWTFVRKGALSLGSQLADGTVAGGRARGPSV